MLGDDSKRAIYDKYGEEGVRDYEQMKGTFHSEFNQNFQYWQDQHKRWEEQTKNQHKQKERVFKFQKQNEDYDSRVKNGYFYKTDVRVMDLETIGDFYRRDSVWILYLYKPYMEKVVRFKDEYTMVAEIMMDLVPVAAIDCSIEGEMCDDFDIWTMP